MLSQKYDRFKDAPWFSEEKSPILIGGAGGIGSWLAVLATRAGFECHVYDFDTLEAINMAGQLFFHSDIGKPKVEALANVVRATCDEELMIYNEKVDENTMTNNIVFTAFDNLTARRHMFESWVRDFKGDSGAVFIDGRLMAEHLTIFIVRGDDEEAINDYFKHLPSDDLVAEAPCTFKQVSHNAAMIAAKMVAYLTNFITGVRSDDKSRATPYKTEEMTALDYRKQHYRPAKPIPAPDLTFEGQGDTDPSEVELEDVVEDDDTEMPEATLDYGTAGEMESNQDFADAFFNPNAFNLEPPARPTNEDDLVPAGAIPTPPRFVNPSVALRELVREKNLQTFPQILAVTTLSAREMYDHFAAQLTFSERMWLTQNQNVVFTTNVEMYDGIPELIPFLQYITLNNLGQQEMEQHTFERMIMVAQNILPENRDEAVRLARQRGITLTDELPF